MHEYTALENFWKRYNKVLLDKLGLDREKQTLEDENRKLKALLKQYLDGKNTIHVHVYIYWQLITMVPLAYRSYTVSLNCGFTYPWKHNDIKHVLFLVVRYFSE